MILHYFKKIVRIIIMASVSTSLLTACSVPMNEREGRAEEFLSRRYGKEFEITRVYPPKFGELYYTVQAYPVDEPLIRFTAAIDTEDDNFSDNYVERRVCAKISEQAAKNLDRMPGYYYLYTHGLGPQPITDDTEITVKDYAELNPYNSFRVEVFVVPEKKDADAFYNGLMGIFDSMDYLKADVCLYIINEEQMEDIQAFFEENDSLDYDFMRLTEKCFSIDISYTDGKVEMSKDKFAVAVKEVL